MEFLSNLYGSDFTGCVQASIPYNDLENDTFKIAATSARGQLVKGHVECT